MRSPLVLEQTVKGLSGGLVTQFSNRRAEAQRDPTATFLASNPITSSFVGALYRSDGDAENVARDVKAQATDKRVALDNSALADFAVMQALRADERRAHAKKLAAENPQLLEAVLDEFEKHQKGFDGADRIAAGLGVRDGSRAEYLRQRLAKLPPEDGRKFVEGQMKKRHHYR